MTTQLHKASERGTADFGWLKANFSFSFGNYYNPNKIQFGALRVLNDDAIAAGMGFGTHPHDNMEIITIPLEGGLKHRDSMGNEAIVRFGEVQVMSAGTGILHSEMNPSQSGVAKTLQIWVFPEIQNVNPRYDQKSFNIDNQINTFVNVVAPHDKNNGEALWIYQQAFFSLGIFESGKNINYKINVSKNGVYVFLIDGEIEINETILQPRDALEITETSDFNIIIKQKAKILLMEVPVNI